MKKSLQRTVVENLRIIIHERNLKQAVVGRMASISESQFSRVLSGKVTLSIEQLEQIASGLGMRAIDVITYPEVYVSKKEQEDDRDVLIQFRVRHEKKDQVLRCLFGDNVDILDL